MPSALQLEIGRRIRERRKEAGKSQEGFARDAGVERSFYGKIERGTHNVTLDTLGRIATALDVDLGELLAGLPAATGGPTE